MPKDQRKLPPFIEGKVRLWYRLTNKNKTGFMSKNDFNEMADTFISEFKLDDKIGKEIRSWLVDGWDALITQGNAKPQAGAREPLITKEAAPLTLKLAANISKGDKINEDLYVDAYSEILNISKDLFINVFAQMVSTFFSIYDTDRDGLISEEDMKRGLKCFGIDKSDALKKVFAELDTTGSGKVGRELYVSAWVEFFTGIDETAPMAKHLNPKILYPAQDVDKDTE